MHFWIDSFKNIVNLTATEMLQIVQHNVPKKDISQFCI